VLFKRNLSVAVPNAKTHRRSNLGLVISMPQLKLWIIVIASIIHALRLIDFIEKTYCTIKKITLNEALESL
jgi:hypothetical protein